MKKYKLENDLSVFGKRVESFPDGIGKAFDDLVSIIPDGFTRPYFGISYMTEKGIEYYAAALEKVKGEAEKYNCQRYTIEKGNYLTETIWDWRTKTHLIKDVFGSMEGRVHADKGTPCIEWYKNDSEMVCMVRESSPLIDHD